MTALIALLLAAPVFEAFDGPLDAARWYVGVPQPPAKGALRIPRDGWIVSRGVDPGRIEKLEVDFRSRGGSLEVSFHDEEEPLSGPLGRLVLKRGKGSRRLVVTRDLATLDGEALAWGGPLKGTFRLGALRGDVEVDEVRVEPRLPEPPEPTFLERRNVHFLTTPVTYRAGEAAYARVTMMLWNVEVCFLLRRGTSRFARLAAPVKGAPVLGALVTLGDGKDLALQAGAHPLAMRDWGDESRNLGRREFLDYLAAEYALFEAIQHAQRALNAALPDRKGLEALVHLAVIRHAPNARAAIALAETQKAKAALSALRKAIGPKADLARMRGDQIRAAAATAARAVLGEPPAEWPGFTFDPQNRFLTIQQGRELSR